MQRDCGPVLLVLCAYETPDAYQVLGPISGIARDLRATRAKIGASVGAVAQLGLLWVGNCNTLGVKHALNLDIA